MNDIHLASDSWQKIIDITNACKYQECIGLRQILFLDTNKKTPTWKEFFFNFLKSFIILVTPLNKKKLGIKAYSNPIFFYFPYNTSAMKGNLLPVYEEYRKSGKDCFVVAPKQVSEIKIDITKEDLVNYVGLFSKFGLFIKSLIATNNLMFLLKKNQNSRWLFYSKYLYNIFLTFIANEAWKNILSTIKPNALISTSDYFPIDYALFYQAKKKSIPNYLIQHGIIGISYYPFTANKMFVYGDIAKQEMIYKGCNPDKIILGGMPSIDNQINSPFISPKKLNNNNTNKKLLILSDTQGQVIYQNVYFKYKENLEKLLNSNPQIQFLVKLHPAESKTFYLALESKFSNLIILPKSTSLLDSFQLATFAATIWSTAGIDAMNFDIPLIVLNVDPSVEYYATWPKNGGGRYLSDLVDNNFKLDLSESISSDILRDQKIFVKSYFANRGKAALTIKSIIDNYA